MLNKCALKLTLKFSDGNSVAILGRQPLSVILESRLKLPDRASLLEINFLLRGSLYLCKDGLTNGNIGVEVTTCPLPYHCIHVLIDQEISDSPMQEVN
jgi:hypothetical protein